MFYTYVVENRCPGSAMLMNSLNCPGLEVKYLGSGGSKIEHGTSEEYGYVKKGNRA